MTPTDPYAHRRGTTRVRLLDAAGEPLARREVVVEQTAHAFGFGNIGFDLVPFAQPGGPEADAAAGGRLADLAERYLALFNRATLPFYWRQFEPDEGAPRTAELEAAARWFVERGVQVKGHTLVWHTLAPQWLAGRGVDEVERVALARIAREVGHFAGLVGSWDVVNEAVIAPVFTAEANAITPLAAARGRVPYVAAAFAAARAADPAARLVLNDFDLSPAYEHLIEECLAAGVPIDAIGLQTHMHQGYRGEEQVTAVLDRFARFGLPLQLTETTLVSGDLMPPHVVDLNDWQVPSWPSTPEGEARQADEIVRHYRTLVAHPAVESATYWGITDVGAWLGAPAGLLRLDGSPKPAYDALLALVKGEWWVAPTTTSTDDDGVVEVAGFAGEYRVALAGASSSGSSSGASVTVTAGVSGAADTILR